MKSSSFYCQELVNTFCNLNDFFLFAFLICGPSEYYLKCVWERGAEEWVVLVIEKVPDILLWP